ncbi:MAG: F0F1 ATP synthase subunit B [Gammaproteobacteria bacterium]|nr:F0F1 ATP synthase subunit B [Gammaproteobacteria bacterium]MDE0364709.1 F0F1 ATP synthase subunit B [Gammaproteobacteria bacterium]
MNLNLTLIGQSLTFFLFAWFCMKFIWPFIKNAMRERQETIAQGLAAGEEAERKLAEAESGAEEERATAKAEAAQIIEQARQRAGQMIEDARAEAREEGERLVEAARSEIDQEVNRAREALRAQVAALAVSGAEKVLGETIDASRHSQMLERLAAEL